MATYKDKLKPIAAPAASSYKTKLVPIAKAPAPAPAKKKGFFPKLKSAVDEAAQMRAKKLQDIADATARGEQSKAEGVFQTGGQLIAGAFEGPMALLKTATPKPVKTIVKKAIFKPIEKVVTSAADKISDIPAVQKFAQTPGAERLARNVEAVPEYLNLLPVPKAGKAFSRATEAGLEVAERGVQKTSGMFTKFAEQQAGKRAVKAAKEIDELAGKISQGTPEELPQFKKAISNIEVKGVKTYKDLKNRINEKIKAVSGKLDEVLAKNPTTRTIANLKTTVNVGNQKVATNFVEDALKQLDTYYKTTNNLAGQAKVQALLQKGNTSGLTIKEINDLARMHGQDLSGFNANGELASGLSRQGAENTRKGLKAIGRDLFGDKLYQEADGEIASLINARDLVEKMETNVAKLKQKIMPRNLGQRAGRLMFKVANLFSFGGLKGFLEAALIPRGQGFKTLNAIDLEKYLQKNLSKMENLLDANLPENDLIRRMEDLLQSAEKEQALMLPARGQTSLPRSTINLPQSARETNLGLDEVRGANINQSSTALPASQPNTINASSTPQNVDINKVIPRNDPVVDPYIPEDQLPTIQMGRVPKRKIDGPIVEYGSNPAVFIPENRPVKVANVEEFVKGHGEPYFHGTNQKNLESFRESGYDIAKNAKGYAESPYALFTTRNASDASMYGQVTELYPVEKIKVLDGAGKEWAETMGTSRGAEESARWAEVLKKRGYDVIEHGNEQVILSPEKFKTRQQLEAMYKKGGKKSGFAKKKK